MALGAGDLWPTLAAAAADAERRPNIRAVEISWGGGKSWQGAALG